jgi:hypothetical protein
MNERKTKVQTLDTFPFNRTFERCVEGENVYKDDQGTGLGQRSFKPYPGRTVIRFISNNAKLGICTVVGV